VVNEAKKSTLNNLFSGKKDGDADEKEGDADDEAYLSRLNR